jgi:hypothetical protein
MNDMGVPDVLRATIEQMHEWPVSVMLVACLLVLGYALKLAHFVPNRMIPIVVMGLGLALNVFIGDTGKVAPNQRHPEVVLGLYGLMLGFISWVSHHAVIKRFEKYLPMLQGKEGGPGDANKNNTKPPTKPKP